ncbi:MFS transporter [Streptomyces sp. MP131-18]|uniref:MFS transporter n=1 Tax=Streptomyces sp. MP131-18 TaxID=1857892 RepID=UPI00209B4D4B|nr:MFS transporter [Streptomyces sp. MP131-18]
MAAPSALALITTTFPEGKPRNRAMGVYAAMAGIGSAVGLPLGGILTDVLSWRGSSSSMSPSDLPCWPGPGVSSRRSPRPGRAPI